MRKIKKVSRLYYETLNMIKFLEGNGFNNEGFSEQDKIGNEKLLPIYKERASTLEWVLKIKVNNYE